jgi:hypothetical protein
MPQYPFQSHPILENTQVTFLQSCVWAKFVTHTKELSIIILYILSFIFCLANKKTKKICT